MEQKDIIQVINFNTVFNFLLFFYAFDCTFRTIKEIVLCNDITIYIVLFLSIK